MSTFTKPDENGIVHTYLDKPYRKVTVLAMMENGGQRPFTFFTDWPERVRDLRGTVIRQFRVVTKSGSPAEPTHLVMAAPHEVLEEKSAYLNFDYCELEVFDR